MRHKITYIILGMFLCILSSAVFFGYGKGESAPIAEAAKRTFTLDGELYTANNLGLIQKIEGPKDVKYFFGESDEVVLFGKNFMSQNSNTGGVNLFILKKGESEAKKITEEFVEFALLDNAKRNVLFLTPEGRIKKQKLDSNDAEEIADFASVPSISPDDQRLALKKMPEDWTPGGYTEGSPGIIIRDIKTGKERVLADQEADHAAFWTPDGNFLYFFGDNGSGFDSLFLINDDGTERTLLTNVGVSQYNPETIVPSISEPPIISKDGRFFIYESDKEIWLVETDLAQRVTVDARRIGYGVSPQWEVDGESISVIAGGNRSASVITLNLDGTVVK
jgi:dipeptidyl aminopeptidase/acylaminoacyl peptidase